MNLPNYLVINVRTSQLEDLTKLLSTDVNLRRPVAYNLLLLDLNQQRETIGIIENYFDAQEISWRFPYPIYFISDHESALGTISIFKTLQDLPRFFLHKEGKITVKEWQVLDKNKLLQQEIKNTDEKNLKEVIQQYSSDHKYLFQLNQECIFYQEVLKKMTVTIKSKLKGIPGGNYG